MQDQTPSGVLPAASARPETVDDEDLSALRAALGVDELGLLGASIVHARAGDTLCDVGDAATSAWVVVSGRLEAVTVDDDGNEHVIGVVGPNELIGESALLEGGSRRALIRARRRSRLIEVDQRWLQELLSTEPDAALRIVRTVVARGDAPSPHRARVVSILPVSASVAGIAGAIAEGAAEISGRALATVGNAPAAADISTNALGWLDAAERDQDGAVLLGDVNDLEWSVAIAEIADEVYYVADTTDGVAVGEIERHLLEAVPRQANGRRVLVLVHPEGTEQPRATAAWLARRHVDGHLHLRDGSPSDLQRVARHVIGRPLTFGCGAGGVRSWAAVGTVLELAERGIAIDAVAGVSGGAIMSAFLAIGTPLDELEALTTATAAGIIDYTIPIGAVVAGRRVWGRMNDLVGGRDLEDAWLPISVLSTDLTDAQPVHHTAGPMADAIYASMSIPGVFPPVDIDGHLHVDGALFDSIPVEGARRLVPHGHLIIVDLAAPAGQPTEALPRVMNGVSLLLRRAVPGINAPSVPNPLVTLMRATTVASERRRLDALDEVDCHIQLDMSGFGVLDTEKVPAIIALGRSQSRPHLDAYLKGRQSPLVDPILSSNTVTFLPDRSPPGPSNASRLWSLATAPPKLLSRTVAGVVDNVVAPVIEHPRLGTGRSTSGPSTAATASLHLIDTPTDAEPQRTTGGER